MVVERNTAAYNHALSPKHRNSYVTLESMVTLVVEGPLSHERRSV